MRVLVFFDLPVETGTQRKAYRDFRKFLIRHGFIMMQESVYSKIALNQTVVNSIIDSIRNNKPVEGLIQVLAITEKQFSKMEYITGSYNSNVIDSDSRLVIL